MSLPSTPQAIARLIPHQGRMCLLDRVLDCKPAFITCSASSHRDRSNPLRLNSQLPAPVALEYAAQAAALHGALNAAPGVAGRPGYIASARQLRLLVARLDDVVGDLLVRAETLAGDGRQALYRFELHDADSRLLADGRFTVVLDTPLAS
jgi:predicted hotdog family 3-hydroxylacyl-ACP dehydratase